MSRLPLAGQADVRRWARRTVRANRGPFARMMVFFVLATLVGLVGPQILGVLVDSAIHGTSPQTVDVLAAVFLVVLITQALLTHIARVRSTLLGERLLATTREEFIDHSVRLPVGTIEAAGTGELLSRATTDVDRVDYTVRYATPEIAGALITLLLTAVAMIVTSPLLACGMLIAVPLITTSTRWYYRRAKTTLETMLSRWSDVHSSMHESMRGARTIESLGLAERRVQHNDRVLESALKYERRHRGLLTVWLPTLELANVLPVAAVLLLGSWAYAAGAAELGTITTVVLYAQAMAGPLNELLFWVDDLLIGNAALRRVLGVGKVPVERGDARAELQSVPSAESFQIRDLRFEYVPGHEVLHGIELDIPAGQRLVIVGPSGAGKSTLGRLIAGVSPPTSGTVRIGGTDITTLSTEQVRREVVLLTQEQHVFAATLRENLTLAVDADDDVLFETLDTVGAVEWANRLPDGLDTPLGAGGHPVSAALAQQLALARVLLTDPHTLVLDEATSLLDNATSRALERSLSTVLAGRTVIAIAHRLHTARTADMVAVMEEGRIVEHGVHSELLASGGSYARLHKAAGVS